jgi:hypothetical protein
MLRPAVSSRRETVASWGDALQPAALEYAEKSFKNSLVQDGGYRFTGNAKSRKNLGDRGGVAMGLWCTYGPPSEGLRADSDNTAFACPPTSINIGHTLVSLSLPSIPTTSNRAHPTSLHQDLRAHFEETRLASALLPVYTSTSLFVSLLFTPTTTNQLRTRNSRCTRLAS